VIVINNGALFTESAQELIQKYALLCQRLNSLTVCGLYVRLTILLQLHQLYSVGGETVRLSDEFGSVWNLGFCDSICLGQLREETKTEAGIACLREDFRTKFASVQSKSAIYRAAAFLHCILLSTR
jgi:hypothetical protein